MSNEAYDATLIKNLGDGLVLRRSTPADAGRLAEFNAAIHSDDGPEKPDMRIDAWVRDLLERPHPTCGPADFTLVEDTHDGKIVSSLNLISQTWTYGGIPFGVGRPELVGTLPEYRNRGLVRAQFDVVHSWSAERGELLQAITGIPYYYRLFGYDMCLSLGGGRAGYLPNVPPLKEGEQEAYSFRPAGKDDISFLQSMDDQFQSRSLVSCVRDAFLWEYELTGKSDKNVNRTVFEIIETNQGDPIGVIGYPPYAWGTMQVAVIYEVRPGVSWGAVTPAVIRRLVSIGKAHLEELSDSQADAPKDIEGFGLWFGVQHPAYEVSVNRVPRVRPPYAFYIRVPDLPVFLRKIAPVLEERLAASPMQGHSGELTLTFYRSGLRLAFEQGRLAVIEPWQPTPVGHSGNVGFPELTFLHVLFGYHSLDELRSHRADVFFQDDVHYALINALFPKQFSDLWPVS